MKRMKTSFHGTALALVAALVLSACGGGGGTAGGATPAAQSAAVFVGPIGGFGSVVVNGTRFSSVGATLIDDDGQSVNLDQLKLGMTVRVSGDADDATQQGSASQLEVLHGTRGRVTAVDSVNATLTLLGQTVKTDASTVYQGVANLAALTVGQSVEVYGALQADGSLLATLVEVKAINALSLSGVVSNLNTTASSFQVGTLTVNYLANSVTGTLADGKRVKINAATAGLVGSVLTATRVQVLGAGSAWGSAATTNAILRLKGVAETAPDSTGLLNVSGTPVNVSKAVIEGGAAIIAGQFVEVKGTWDGSTLQATKVELEGNRESKIGGRNELYGAVSSVSGNTVVVDGVTVDLSAAVFSHGSLAQVVVGTYVEIKGNMVGDTLQARRVELKNGGAAKGMSYEQFGQVADFVSSANFTLNGLKVDASAAVFEHGSAATSLANGVYVEVTGTQDSNGVFVASKLEIKPKMMN